MRFYLEVIKNQFQANIAYRLRVVLTLLHRVAGLLVEVSIWKALIGAQGVETYMGIVTLEEMVTYALLGICISIFVSNDVIIRVQNKVRSGEIALDLIKPMKFNLYLLCENLGNNLFKIIFELLPVLVIGITLFEIIIPCWFNLLLFFIVLGLGFIIYFLIAYLIGQLSFWFLTIWHLDRLLNDIFKIFSGRFIPLWFFPGFLRNISLILPFRLIYFAPMSIYLNKVSVQESLGIIATQLLWIGTLFVIERIVWNRGVRKLVVQGG